MSNLFRRFKALLPDAPLLVGTVVATAPLRVQLPDGTILAVRGEAMMGQSVFVRGAVIEGPAPALPVTEIEV